MFGPKGKTEVLKAIRDFKTNPAVRKRDPQSQELLVHASRAIKAAVRSREQNRLSDTWQYYLLAALYIEMLDAPAQVQ